jgi:hypothetical protein
MCYSNFIRDSKKDRRVIDDDNDNGERQYRLGARIFEMLSLRDIFWLEAEHQNGFETYAHDPKDGEKSSNSRAICINCKSPLEE